MPPSTSTIPHIQIPIFKISPKWYTTIRNGKQVRDEKTTTYLEGGTTDTSPESDWAIAALRRSFVLPSG